MEPPPTRMTACLHGLPGRLHVLLCHLRLIPDLRRLKLHRHIRGRQGIPAEYKGFLGDPVTHAVRTYGHGSILMLPDNGTAAETDGDHIRHTEIRADAADRHGNAGFPWKAR